jgi:hypothetical protein
MTLGLSVLKAIRSLSILFLIGSLWAALLWFGLRVDFSSWPLPKTIGVHVLPPLAVWGLWWVGGWYRNRRARLAVEAKEQSAASERNSVLAAAKQKWEDDLRRIRFAIQCRGVAVGELAVADPLPDLPDKQFTLHQAQPDDVAAASASAEEPMDSVLPALKTALTALYAQCSAAAVLPIYLRHAHEVSFGVARQSFLTVYRAVAEDLSLESVATQSPLVVALPFSASTVDCLVDLFEHTEDLPGALVVALDSPIAMGAHDAVAGEASHGVFVLLLTSPRLAALLAALPKRVSTAGEPQALPDHFRAHWDTPSVVEGHLGRLAPLPDNLRDQLIELPVLAHLHKSELGQWASPFEMGNEARRLIEQARIKACLTEPPLWGGEEAETAAVEAAGEAVSPSECGGLIYNAGTGPAARDALTALLEALYPFGIHLPVDKTMNISRRIGNLGQATSVGMVALSVIQAATEEKAILLGEFVAEGLALSFIVPEVG